MSVLEGLKKTAEKATGYGRPQRRELREAVRKRKPRTFRLKDDGFVPNNGRLPLVVYRSAVRLAPSLDPAAVFEELFELNGWGDAWRNGIYGYVHYHSRIHEVLGIARGTARVQFGGTKGRTFELAPGDVVILPAGTGHQRLAGSQDLLVVGAYPRSGKYDECRPTQADHDRALTTIPRLAVPKKDPVYGREGPLPRLWQKT